MAAEFEGRPLHFSSDTLNALVLIGITTVICIPCLWAVLRVVRDIRHNRKIRRDSNLQGSKENDPEKGFKTDLELGGCEKNGGLCELEQPGIPELSGIGILELWDEGCAKEVDGKVVVAELYCEVLQKPKPVLQS